MRSLAVYCGSSPGRNPAFVAAAARLGTLLGERGIELVYGGGRVGMMGTVADACLRAGGRVTGVIPGHLMGLEVGHAGLSQLHLVESMHERKALMASLSDAFLVLPGGFGTLDEMFEALTWSQLGLQEKACGLLNIAGYFDGLLAFLERMVGERFLLPEHQELLVVRDGPEEALEALEEFRPVRVPGWVERKISADASGPGVQQFG